MWKTINALGKEMVWYSEDEYNKLKEKLEYFEKCHKDLDNYIPALINGELGYIKKSKVNIKIKILKFILNILDKNTNCSFFHHCIKPRRCGYRFCFLRKIYDKISEVIDER